MLDTLLLAAWIGCQSLDLGTTAYALNTGRFRESNPIMAGKHLVPLKVSVNVAMYLWYRNLPKGKKWQIAAPMAGTGCVAGAINLKRLRE